MSYVDLHGMALWATGSKENLTLYNIMLGHGQCRGILNEGAMSGHGRVRWLWMAVSSLLNI